MTYYDLKIASTFCLKVLKVIPYVNNRNTLEYNFKMLQGIYTSH